mmetsp:Transcript_13514/g.34798  ORF Transcript_13514/g.34798 Transcript_13514/m.34798 type:complete len:101 (+) Transcript_13514:107-409(+)
MAMALAPVGDQPFAVRDHLAYIVLNVQDRVHPLGSVIKCEDAEVLASRARLHGHQEIAHALIFVEGHCQHFLLSAAWPPQAADNNTAYLVRLHWQCRHSC